MTNKSREQRRTLSTIVQGKDGVYRWLYEIPMLGNMSMLFSMWKILGISLCVPVLLLMIMGLMQGKGWQAVSFALQILLITACLMLALSLPAYLFVASRHGWNYGVRFEMDNRGIRHTPTKVVIIGWVMRLLAASGRTSLYTEFSQVKNIKVYPQYNLIKVNAPFNRNHVYVDQKDFKFVLDFIVSRCPAAKVSK